MVIEKVPVEKLNPAPYNPRRALRPGDPEWNKLVRSIEEFGFVEPLVWNKRSGNLVGGHQRLRVLKSKGIREVEVSVVDLDPQKEKALNVALNKVSGEWDEAALKDLLAGLQAEGYDVTATGFDGAELDKLLAEAEADAEPEAEVPFSPELGEENNYVVLKFTNSTDWLNALTMLGLETVAARRRNGKPWSKGIGRVVDGPDAIARIKGA